MQDKLTPIKLIEGQFTALEASDLLTTLIDEKINFHKINRLKRYEVNHTDEGKLDNSRIDQLKAEKNNLRAFFKNPEQRGKFFDIDCKIVIKEGSSLE